MSDPKSEKENALLKPETMDPPVSLQDRGVHNKKVDVLHAIRPVLCEHVRRFAMRGQYSTGRIEGQHMQFRYRKAFQSEPPEAYETLLGDATLFMRADQVEAAWAVITPILEAREAIAPVDQFYQAGTCGPEAAEVLIAQDGRCWLLPTS